MLVHIIESYIDLPKASRLEAWNLMLSELPGRQQYQPRKQKKTDEVDFEIILHMAGRQQSKYPSCQWDWAVGATEQINEKT